MMSSESVSIESYENKMRQLDALKVAFMKNKYTEYMETFINIRLKLIEQIIKKSNRTFRGPICAGVAIVQK